MTDLVEWLEAQLAEDERIARAAQRATDGRWHFSGGNGDPHLITRQPDQFKNRVVVYDEGSPSDEEAAHIALHDPQSALADIAAKRLILFYHSGNHECSGPDDNCMWIEDDVCPTVRALVSAFAARPGYDPAWGAT